MFRPGCRSFCAGVLLLTAGFCPSRLSALDTHRKLTQYLHRTWQTEQGFADVQIDSLTQTRDGYLWLGTYTGLVRFDGVRFTAIAGPKRVLDSVWVRSVVEDAQGSLWIGTNDAGLIRLQNGAVTQYSDYFRATFEPGILRHPDPQRRSLGMHRQRDGQDLQRQD